MRYNPFQPNRIINPAMFVGRLAEIHTIEHFLFQAKGGNAQNFLVEGERGIGKSSLLRYISMVATSQLPVSGGSRFDFVLVSIDLGGAHSQVDIVRAIGRELRKALGARDSLRENAKKAWDFLTNWEILGVRYHKSGEAFDPDDAKDSLVDQLAEVSGAPGIDGILILIDEADAAPTEAHLGEFSKSVTERLSRKGIENVILGLAGLPTLIGRLRSSHESAPRIFSMLELKPLTMSERKMAVQIGMDIANEKNGQKTLLESSAADLLADLSEGYPHFIQQFGYCAFEADKDYLIDDSDVLKGAYSENGAISQLDAKYFEEAYVSKINSDDYRTLLNVMADHGDSWVSRKDLIQQSCLKDTTVNNALGALKRKEIILADESRQGHYRLPTRSFAAWINAIKSAPSRSDFQNLELPFAPKP